jgi:hypothetical protein
MDGVPLLQLPLLLRLDARLHFNVILRIEDMVDEV